MFGVWPSRYPDAAATFAVPATLTTPPCRAVAMAQTSAATPVRLDPSLIAGSSRRWRSGASRQALEIVRTDLPDGAGKFWCRRDRFTPPRPDSRVEIGRA